MQSVFRAALPLGIFLHAACSHIVEPAPQAPATAAPIVAQAATKPCPRCPPDESSMPGKPIRGVVQAVDSVDQVVSLKHGAASEALPAGTTRFRVEPSLLETLKPGVEVLGRVEKRENTWWLFHVRMLVRVDPAANPAPAPP